jgi:hypothetical protein
MTQDALSVVISPEEVEHFRTRNPKFAAALERLEGALRLAFLRKMEPLPDKPSDQQFVVFFLTHQAIEEFFDILQLAVHGNGLGALRLLRALYERVVAALYLVKHPEEVQNFNDYADVHARRTIKHAEGTGDIRRWVSQEKEKEVEVNYQRVKPGFQETVCRKCRTTRDMGTWSRKDPKVQAQEVGLERLYLFAYFWPTMLLHTTRLSLESRLKVTPAGFEFQHGPRHEDADYALSHAHSLIVKLVTTLNEFFVLAVDVATLSQDVRECWGSTPAASGGAPE